MKAQNVERSITVVQGSEFGRTITPNSQLGSDHAWGGNYFAFGGDILGGKILGQYPESFGVGAATNVGRGRILPTTSWDALWYGIAQWMGVTEQDDLDRVLPNNGNFGCALFSETVLFENGSSRLRGCGGPIRQTEILLVLPLARYLTGVEQKEICKLAVSKISFELDVEFSDSRCSVTNQIIEQNPPVYELTSEISLSFDSTIHESLVTDELLSAIQSYVEENGQIHIIGEETS